MSSWYETVGAGDTFSAALLISLAQRRMMTRAVLQYGCSDEDLEELLRFAAAAAALNCTRAGANPPHAVEVEHFLRCHPRP